MTDHPPTHEPDIAATDPVTVIDDLIDCARQAENAVRRLAHLTLRAPDIELAEVDTLLSHLAETVAAIPQVARQVGTILDHTRQTHLLAMDGKTDTTDPDLAIDTARRHLDEVLHPAVATYRHLNAARNEVAHISVTGVLPDESWTQDRGAGQRRHRTEERDGPRQSPARHPGPHGPGR